MGKDLDDKKINAATEKLNKAFQEFLNKFRQIRDEYNDLDLDISEATSPSSVKPSKLPEPSGLLLGVRVTLGSNAENITTEKRKMAAYGRKRTESNHVRINNSTKKKRNDNQPFKEAVWREAANIVNVNKRLRGKPYSMAANIREKIKDHTLKPENEVLYPEKPSGNPLSKDTLVRYIKSSPKPL